MSDASPPNPAEDRLPETEVRTRAGFSIIWLIPIVAAAIAIWLAYTTISEEGPTVDMTFKTAQGLEAGKTKVKYKDVDVGLVTDVELSEDLTRIIVTARLNKGTEPHLKDQTRFWVVRPRLGAGGVSGLDTLLSGAYIEIDPGPGESRREFIGLEVPPEVRSDVPGRRFVLESDQLGSLGPGSPVYFRGLRVGQILGYELAEDMRRVRLPVFVEAPYDRLVQDTTRFWNASGFEVTVSADGVKVSTESVQSILMGGVAFETPSSSTETKPSSAGTRFRLFKDFASIKESTYTEKIRYLLYFDDSVRGLVRDSPVELKGIKVGSVVDVRLEVDTQSSVIRIPVTIDIEPQRVSIIGDLENLKPHEAMAALVNRGLRAQLKSGNLLTGQLLVALDFYSDAGPVGMEVEGPYPVIPTVPSEIEGITRSVSDTLDKIASLPLTELAQDLRRTIRGAESLITSPELKDSVATLNRSLAGLETMVDNIDAKVGPLLTSLEKASQAATETLEQIAATAGSAESMVGEDSEFRYDLTLLMQELTETARSVRLLADYLEQNPDALIRGKGAPAQ